MSPAEAEFLKIKTIKFSDIFLAWFLWTQPVHECGCGSSFITGASLSTKQ
jgi:hypothetical protein